MLLLMLCGCVAVRVRNIPGDRWKKAQVQELAGWWCTNDKELWRCEITGNNEMLIGSIAKRANDQFELLDSIAIPTRLGNRDLLFVRIKTKIATEAGYGFVLMQFKDKDHLTLVFPNRRFDQSRNRYVTEAYTSTWNGTEERSFFGRDVFDEDLHPTGFQSHHSLDWDTYQVLPLLLAVRPLNAHFSPILTRAYSVSSEVTERDGRILLELAPQGPIGTQDPAYVYFVDPQRDFCISRIAKHWMGQKLWELDISYERDLRVNAWLPQSWKLADQSMKEERIVSRVDAYFGDALANEQFRFEFPFGTLVSNRIEEPSVVYIALREDGRCVIPRESRRNSIPYLEYLTKARSSEHNGVK